MLPNGASKGGFQRIPLGRTCHVRRPAGVLPPTTGSMRRKRLRQTFVQKTIAQPGLIRRGQERLD